MRIKSLFDKLIGRKKDEELICQKCGKPIEVPSFIMIKGEVILNSRTPKVFTCPEQAFNYAQVILMHTIFWMDLLREYGSPLYDLGKIYKEYDKKNKNKEVK